MKNIYPISEKTWSCKTLITVLLILVANLVFSQVMIDFEPRTSQYSPTKTIYNIHGDFKLMGNTNMTLETYDDDGQNGNSTMVYVDIDGVDTTFNSSTAELVLDPIIDYPECANIIYAGLYWSGRAHDGTSPNTFQVTKIIDVPGYAQYDQTVGDNDAITYTDYTLPISRSGDFYNRTITYSFQATGDTTVTFVYAHNSGSQTLTVSVNGGTATPVSTTSIDANDAYFTTPYVISNVSGGDKLTVDHLEKGGANADEDDSYAYVQVYVNGSVSSFTKTYDKSVVYLMHEDASDYTKISATDANFTDNIYYPTTSEGYMYSAYAEITDYVTQYGVGDYTVADVACSEGNGGGTGFYGGWALIIVYEYSEMALRDVIVFDGHAYVVGQTTISHELPVSGFNTTQSGPVNMKLGLVAGEGDRPISGDYFQIRDTLNANWVPLSHGGNTTSNFFNSSVYTGGNYRLPSQLNNYGMDISMFDIPNTDNYLITNNQDSTTFRYGSTQDTYIIFCMAMAVDAYIPEPEGLNQVSMIANMPPGNPPTAEPGDTLEYTLEIRNRGNEPMEDVMVTIPMPYSANFVSCSATFESYPSYPSGNLAPLFDVGAGATGSILWQIGYLPLPADPDDLLATLTFKLKVTEDCIDQDV